VEDVTDDGCDDGVNQRVSGQRHEANCSEHVVQRPEVEVVETREADQRGGCDFDENHRCVVAVCEMYSRAALARRILSGVLIDLMNRELELVEADHAEECKEQRDDREPDGEQDLLRVLIAEV